jgi:hypothetical protein
VKEKRKRNNSNSQNKEKRRTEKERRKEGMKDHGLLLTVLVVLLFKLPEKRKERKIRIFCKKENGKVE